MQHLEGSGTPVLYIGRKFLKGYCVTTNVTKLLMTALVYSVLSCTKYIVFEAICDLMTLMKTHI
jgi:hypothetical protein